MGVKVFQDPDLLRSSGSSGNFEGPAPWEKNARLGRDGLSLEFVYLDEIDDIAQWYEYAGVKGTQKDGREWNFNIPCGDDDPPQLVEGVEEGKIRKRYQYASNIFILKCIDTESREERELNGAEIETPWKDRSIEDRVKVLRQGKDTSNTFLLQMESWKEDGVGITGHVMNLDRYWMGNRTGYQLRFTKDLPKNSIVYKNADEIEEAKHSIVELLEFDRQQGLKGIGVIPRGGDGDDSSKKESKVEDSDKDMVVEGNGDDDDDEDIFDKIDPKDFIS